MATSLHPIGNQGGGPPAPPGEDPGTHHETPGELLLPARPRLLELQIAASALGTMVMNRLRVETICAGQEIQPLNDPVYVIDHVEFHDPAVLGDPPPAVSSSAAGGFGLAGSVQATLGNQSSDAGNVPLRFLQLIISATLYLKLKSDLIKPETSKTVAREPGLTLYFSVTAEGGDLCITYNTVRALGLSSKDIASIHSALQLVRLCSPLDLGALPDIFGDVTVARSLVGSDDAFSILAVRLQLGESVEDDEAWPAFADAPVVNFLNDLDWAVLIDARLLRGVFEDFVASLAARHSDVAISTGPTAKWNPIVVSVQMENGYRDFFGGFTVTLSGDTWPDGLCDIGFSAEVSAALTVPQHNRLEMTISFGVSPNYWDAFLCAGPLGDFAAGVAAETALTPKPADIPSACELRRNWLLVCDYDVNLAPMKLGSSIGFGTLVLTTYRPQLAGPLLGGRLDIQKIGEPFLKLHITDQFSWAILGDCGNFEIGAKASLHLSGSAPLQGAPVRLCKSIQILNDELNLFTPRLQLDPLKATWLPLDVNFVLHPSEVPLDSPYWANPYGPLLLIETNAGCRTIELAPIPPWTQELIDQLGLRFPLLEANCDAPQAGLFGNPSQFDPHWLIDPGPAEANLLWEGVVTGARPGDSFTLSGPEGVIMRTSVTGVGVAELAGALPADRQLRVNRTTHEERAQVPADVSSARLRERHVEMLRRQEIAGSGTLRFLAGDQLDGAPIALIGWTDGLRVLDVSNPLSPLTIGEAPGVRGALAFGADLAYWGEQGIAFWSREQKVDTPILNCVRVGKILAALTYEGLVILNRSLRSIGRLELPNRAQLIPSRHALIVLVADGLAVIDISHPERPTKMGDLPIANARSISAGGLPKSGGRITVQAGNEYITFDVSHPPKIKRLATHSLQPWSFGAVETGKCWLRPEKSGSHIAIYTQGRVRSTYTVWK